MQTTSLEKKTFILLLILVTIAFIWILLPFYGAVFWAVALPWSSRRCNGAWRGALAGAATCRPC